MPVATGRITHQSVIRCLGASATVIIGFDTEYEIKTDEDVELPDQHPGNHVLCYTFTVAELLGFSKIELPPGAIEHMSKLMHDDPALFEAYAVRDAEVAAAWLIAMLRFFEVELGINPGRQPPATLGAAAVKKFKALCKDEDYPLDDLLGFERIETIVNGRRRSVRQKMAPYRDRESFFADCYHGGRNEAYYAGFTPEGVITDLDICGAYTTAMAAIRTPDWRKAADTTEIDILTEAGERGMAVARVRFRFPAGTRFPCLPIRAGDAGLIYPLSGVSYATGPELVVARRLGAIIEVERGVFVPWLDERRPFSLVTEVVNDIRKRHTKGTAFERAGKEIGNSLYGKLGQGIDLLKSPEGAGKAHVRGKRVFDSRKGEMTTLPPSSISSAALAAFIPAPQSTTPAGRRSAWRLSPP